VGDVANGALSYDFGAGHMLQGSAMSFAVNIGRIAGENAVTYMRK
jgi:hypothetical protein